MFQVPEDGKIATSVGVDSESNGRLGRCHESAGGRLFCGGRSMARSVCRLFRFFSGGARLSMSCISGARRGCEHACHHQISVLADNGGKRRGGLRLRQLRRGVLPERNGGAEHLRGRGYRRSAGAACHEMRMNASI